MLEDMRVGIIGYDTSHAPAFARLLNVPGERYHVPGATVVCGYPTYSSDIDSSRSRVDGYRAELAALGVREVSSVEELLEGVDAVLLESVDGRRHLKEALPVFAATKPLFIDKPLAADYVDALKIVQAAQTTGTPLFSASSLRFDANVLALKEKIGSDPVYGCDAFSPATLEPTNPGLFWYGVHAVELLYAFMGAGCHAVRCISTADADCVVGEWDDERLGTVRGTRSGDHDYGVTVFSSSTFQTSYNRDIPIYAQLLRQIVSFFKGEPAPVAPAETLETMAFMQAALESANSSGTRIPLPRPC